MRSVASVILLVYCRLRRRVNQSEWDSAIWVVDLWEENRLVVSTTFSLASRVSSALLESMGKERLFNATTPAVLRFPLNTDQTMNSEKMLSSLLLLKHFFERREPEYFEPQDQSVSNVVLLQQVIQTSLSAICSLQYTMLLTYTSSIINPLSR